MPYINRSFNFIAKKKQKNVIDKIYFKCTKGYYYTSGNYNLMGFYNLRLYDDNDIQYLIRKIDKNHGIISNLNINIETTASSYYHNIESYAPIQAFVGDTFNYTDFETNYQNEDDNLWWQAKFDNPIKLSHLIFNNSHGYEYIVSFYLNDDVVYSTRITTAQNTRNHLIEFIK